MKTSTEELKRLAEAVVSASDNGTCREFEIARMEFRKIADPAAVLELIRQRDELLAALKEARELVEDWGAYAPAYMQEKHDLHGDLSRLDAAIAKAEG